MNKSSLIDYRSLKGRIHVNRRASLPRISVTFYINLNLVVVYSYILEMNAWQIQSRRSTSAMVERNQVLICLKELNKVPSAVNLGVRAKRGELEEQLDTGDLCQIS